MSGPTVNVASSLISQYIIDHPGALADRLVAYTSGPVFAVNYHLDYTDALETSLNETYIKTADQGTAAADAVSAAITAADIPSVVSSDYTAADIPGQISSAYTSADIPGQISTAFGAVDLSIAASGAVSDAVSGAIASPDGALYVYTQNTIHDTVIGGLMPIYERIRTAAGFMQMFAEQSNLKDAYNNPYDWSALMNISPSVHTENFSTLLSPTDYNYPNGYKVGLIITQTLITPDTFVMYNFMPAQNFRYDIYSGAGFGMTPGTSDYSTSDSVNTYTVAAGAAQSFSNFVGFPSSTPFTYYFLVIRANPDTTASPTDPIVLSQKFFTNVTAISFTPY